MLKGVGQNSAIEGGAVTPRKFISNFESPYLHSTMPIADIAILILLADWPKAEIMRGREIPTVDSQKCPGSSIASVPYVTQMRISKLARSLNKNGLMGTARVVHERLFPIRARSAASITKLISRRRGIEIGGPTMWLFGRHGLLPVYRTIGSLDNVNFSSKNSLICSSSPNLEGSIQEGQTYLFDPSRPLGFQYICEMTELSNIPSATYDFLLSSHTLEHTANPIAALHEWLRILKNNSVIVLVLPHKEGSFDHRRPTTTLGHMKDDFDRGMDEHDLSHLPEFLALMDFSLTPEHGSFDNFKEKCLKNFEYRYLHHHTFTTLSAATLLNYMGVQIVSPARRKI
jgi:SAM-dependent methyltransferase